MARIFIFVALFWASAQAVSVRMQKADAAVLARNLDPSLDQTATDVNPAMDQVNEQVLGQVLSQVQADEIDDDDESPQTTGDPTLPTRTYKIDFQHYINETPDPVVAPVPGVDMMAYGIDLEDGLLGFQPIFSLTYDRFAGGINDLTRADRQLFIKGQVYKVPDQINVVGPFFSCTQSGTSSSKFVSSAQELATEESNESSVQTNIPIEVEAEYKGVSASTQMDFGGGFGNSEMAQAYASDSASDYTQAIVSTMTAQGFRVSQDRLPPFSSNFEENVKSLLVDLASGDQSGVLKFFENFGTHYITEAIMGGKIEQMTTFKTGTITDANMADAKKESSNNMSLGFTKVENTNSQAESALHTSQTSEKSMVHEKVFSGGVPSDDFHEWCDSVLENPVMIKYNKIPIQNLFKLVSGVDPVQLQLALMAFQKVERTRCGCVNGGLCTKSSGTCACTGSYTGAKCEIPPTITYEYARCDRLEPSVGVKSNWFTEDSGQQSSRPTVDPIIGWEVKDKRSDEHRILTANKCMMEGEQELRLTYADNIETSVCGGNFGKRTRTVPAECRCGAGRFFTAASCTPGKGWCGSMSVTCGKPTGDTWELGTEYWTPTFGSENGDVQSQRCNNGYIVNGIRCEGNDCDRLALLCAEVKYKGEKVVHPSM